MCGILGWIGGDLNLTQEQLRYLGSTLNHRGPDDEGVSVGPKYGLMFRRLAIIDLSDAGHQPMYDPSGRYGIVFNGEIFNYRELKDQYLYHVKLRGNSDTEVLLHLLIRFGHEALPLLNGMFAFCFIDTDEQEFLLARDRFGIKPLYYTVQNGNCYFASELKALKGFPGLSFTINGNAVYDYLGTGYIGGTHSIYKEVQKLPPATYARGSYSVPFDIVPSPYWELAIHNRFERTYEEALEQFERLFEDAVRIRLRSDVPLGLFLSGGIDSGLVAAFASRFQRVDCYNVNYQEVAHSEWSLAQETARALQFPLNSLQLNADRILEDLDQLVHYYDEPFGDSSALPSYNICKAGSRHATVFLSGDAGDEAFAGYSRYVKRIKSHKLHKAGNLLRFLNKAGSLMPLAYQNGWHKLTAAPQLRDAYYDEIPGNPFHNRLINSKNSRTFGNFFDERTASFKRSSSVTFNQQLFDYQYYLPDDILVKMDRASMANSIEVRSPFLDYRIHEFAASLPRKWLIDGNKGKRFLRDVAHRHLPENVVNAKKSGFGIPVNEWMKKEAITSVIENGMAGSEIADQYLDKKGVTQLIKWHREGKINAGHLVWRLLILMKWEAKCNTW